MFLDKVILVVKDAQTEHKTIRAYLEHEFSKNMILAVSGLKALSHVLVEQPPDLTVVLEPVAWAQLDEVLTRINTHASNPIIFVPTLQSTESVLKAMRPGIDDCIVRMNGKIQDYSSRTFLKLLKSAVHRALRAAGPAVSELDLAAQKSNDTHANQLYLMGKLTSTVAHDFNNLLTIIHGYSHLATQELLDHGDVTKVIQYLDKIESKTTEGSSLIHKIMQFTHKSHAEPIIVNLNAAVNGIKQTFREVISEGIEFTVDLPKTDVPIRIDPRALEMVLMNLINNACEAMQGQGKLTIQVEQREIDAEHAASLNIAANTYAALSISDTGVGMDEITAANIFDAFFTTKKLGVGTGLGLASVHSCVHEHGGMIFVRSAPDQGTTFEILWPRYDAQIDTGLSELTP